MKLKKIILYSFIFLFSFFSLALDSSFPYKDNGKKWIDIDVEHPTTNSKKLMKKYMLDDNKSIFDDLLSIVWIKSYTLKNWSAAYYLQKVFNYFLSILAFIALVVLIYWFYKLLFSGQWFDESYKTAKKYILNALLALFIIGLSWYIISWIFYIVAVGKS